MKITGLSINCMEYQQDFWMSSASANQIYNKRFCILVRIMTDEGIVGIGESDYPGGPPSSVVSVLEKELGPSLIGKNPLDIQAIWDDMYSVNDGSYLCPGDRIYGRNVPSKNPPIQPYWAALVTWVQNQSSSFASEKRLVPPGVSLANRMAITANWAWVISRLG